MFIVKTMQSVNPFFTIGRCASLEEIGLNLNIQGAGGHDIPYIGCILAHFKVPFLPNSTIEVGVLVVPLTDMDSKFW